MPQMYWIVPVEGGNRPDNTLPKPPLGIWGPGFPYPDQGLPGGQGGYPSQPIYHPGHPDHGLPAFPSHPIAPGGGKPPGSIHHPIYHPGHPDHGLPAFPSHPIELPPGGTPIDPPPVIPPPAGHEDNIVVAVYRPEQGWEFKSYDNVEISNPMPTPR